MAIAYVWLCLAAVVVVAASASSAAASVVSRESSAMRSLDVHMQIQTDGLQAVSMLVCNSPGA